LLINEGTDSAEICGYGISGQQGEFWLLLLQDIVLFGYALDSETTTNELPFGTVEIVSVLGLTLLIV
jgi:hypothetical protein